MHLIAADKRKAFEHLNFSFKKIWMMFSQMKNLVVSKKFSMLSKIKFVLSEWHNYNMNALLYLKPAAAYLTSEPV